MTRKISTFIFIGLILTLAAWMYDKTSIVSVYWNGGYSKYSLPEFMLLVLLFVAVVDFVNRILRKLLKTQIKEVYKNSVQNSLENEDASIDVLAAKISDKIVINRKDFDNSLLLVLRAMTSVTAGDMKEARENLRALKRIIGNDPIIDVLKMKIYKGEKDFDKMEKLSGKLMKNEDMQIVGMKAAVEAQMQKKEFKEALETANKAFELRQDLYWVIESAFELRAKAKDWDGAMQVLDAGSKKKIISPVNAKRFKSVVLYEMAMDAKAKGDDVNFFKCCNQAIMTDPTMVPAALAMARYYKENDNQYRKAAKVLIEAWKKNPVDSLAYAYLDLWPNDDILARIRRMDAFAFYNSLRPSLNNRIIAELSAKAGLWGKARGEVELFLINNPCTKKVCDIVIKYESEFTKDKVAVKEWKARLGSCARDSVWVCADCGEESDEWNAVCSNCGAIGRSKWHLYVDENVAEPQVSENNDEDDDED